MKKRLISLFLMLCIIVTLVPALSLPASAASQVYYNIDFSDAVLKSGIGQQVTNDCAVVSVATVEAYLYGATSSADKTTVYNAVVNKNLGTTSGLPNNSAIQSWAALGYVTASYSLQGLYDQIAQGYPVLIYSSGKAHWSVVCGYTGSTSSLQASGFQVVNVYHGGVNKVTLSSWLGSYSGTSIAYRKNGIAITSLSGIHMAVNYPEIVHPYGSGHGVYGYITSSSNLTNVTVSVTNALTGASIFNKSVTPNAKYYTVYNLDSSMTFASWAAGQYYYTITAQDASSNTKTLKKYFTISSTYQSTAPTDPAHTLLCYNNYSGKNYLYDSDFSTLNTSAWLSRDTSVYTLSVDSSVKHNSAYNTLKIVGASAGASGKDLAIRTTTQGNKPNDGYVGDTKTMTLSFWAKSSVSGAKFYFRWGYDTTYKSITLTTDWAFYTIRMDKTTSCGAYIHPYIDTACTVWLSEVQLEDGTSATDFVPESGGLYQSVATIYGTTYGTLPTPVREGYTFDGWYTSNNGGSAVTSSTNAANGHYSVYAHWTAIKNGWIAEDGKWYYYVDGTVTTGWQNIGGKWYYLGTDGAMQTGWQLIGGSWYYLGTNGAMQTGWQYIGGKWYYLGANGAMQTGWQLIGGKWYYLGTNGAMTTGWQLIGGKWYYLGTNGAMQTGWQYIGGVWYYLGTNGAMTTGWQQVNGKWYYMSSSGAMQTGWLLLGTNWYYLGTNGVMVTGTQVISGKTYIFASNGVWIG